MDPWSFEEVFSRFWIKQTKPDSVAAFQKATRGFEVQVEKRPVSMGSSGYPFEHFIGELFRQMGFDVQVGVVVEGNPKSRFSTSYSTEYVLFEKFVKIFVEVRRLFVY